MFFQNSNAQRKIFAAAMAHVKMEIGAYANQDGLINKIVQVGTKSFLTSLYLAHFYYHNYIALTSLFIILVTTCILSY